MNSNIDNDNENNKSSLSNDINSVDDEMQEYGNNNQYINNSNNPSGNMEVMANEGQSEQQPQSLADRKQAKEQQDAKDMENFNNNAAEVAKNMKGVPIAQAAGYVHSGLNKVTGGKWGEATGKITAKANKTLGPAGKKIQKGAKFLNKSGIGDKIGKASSMKNRFSGKGVGGAENAKSSLADKRLSERTNQLLQKKNGGLSKPEEKGDNEGKKNNLANAAKKVAVDKAKEKAKSEIKKKVVSKLILSNPWVLAIIGGAILLLLFIAYIGSTEGDSGGSGGGPIGLHGYEYIEPAVRCDDVYVYNTHLNKETNKYEPGPNDGTYSFEEYIVGVVYAEVGGFDSAAVLQAAAVSARSFALALFASSNNCSIPGNPTRQAFIKASTEQVESAVNSTRGLVLTRDSKIITTQYDAFCWTEKDGSYYYVCQGNYDTGEQLKIPINWVEANVYKTYLAAPRTQAHGNGMSQFGAYYLAKEENYSFDKLLYYFYGSDTKLMSIYKSTTYSGDYDIDPDSDRYQNLKFLTDISISELLSSNNSSLETYNSDLKDVVLKSGVGSREAVVNSAVTLIGSLADMGYKLTYQWGGKYYAIGANPYWGTIGYTDCDNYADNGYDKNTCLDNYKWYSFDCSGFVNWSIVNGFQFKNYQELADNGAYQKTDTTNTISLDPDQSVCEPGDVLVNDSHIVLVVGLDDASKRYIVAESTGSRLATGAGGVKLSYYSYGSTEYRCRSLEDLYQKYGSGIVSGTLLVGDSRMVGSCNVASLCNNSIECKTSACLAKSGASISWFKDIESSIQSNNRRNVVINMGVNDLVGGNADGVADKYWTEYEKVAKNNPKKIIYILSVNPTSSSSVVKPSDVIAFNNSIQNRIRRSNLSNVYYLDSYNNVSFELAQDGIHYSFNTYKAIYDYVMGAVR